MKKPLILLSFIVFPAFSFKVPACSDLTLDEKIGQLMMVATVSSPDINREFMATQPYNLEPSNTAKLIRDYHIGGVVFLGAGTPAAQSQEAQRLQALSKHPLLIGLDAEWGLSMRHTAHVTNFPKAMTLGALAAEHDHLIYELGQSIGTHCKELGVHINFAPVVDVNTDPRNPIINTRSFGEDVDTVARKGKLFMDGIQSVGLLACAKHFPGHGRIGKDSHKGVIRVPHTLEDLRTVELPPFKELIKSGVSAIMTAHLEFPKIQDDDGLVPATMSRRIITGLLREELGFDGLIITDGLGMKGVTDAFPPGDLELKALKAGNDVLLCPVDVPKAVERIKQAVLDGEITEKEIDVHVERILAAKRKAFSEASEEPFDPAALVTPEAQALKEKLYQAAVTIARDPSESVPLKKDKVVLLSFGESSHFVDALKKEKEIEHCPINQASPKLLQGAERLLVSVHLEGRSGMIEMTKEHSISPEYAAMIETVNKYPGKTTLVLFGNPYALEHFPDVESVIVGYENEPEAQQAVASVLVGKSKATGILPVTPLRAD